MFHKILLLWARMADLSYASLIEQIVYYYLNVVLNRSILGCFSHITKCKKSEFIRSPSGRCPELDLIAPASRVTVLMRK